VTEAKLSENPVDFQMVTMVAMAIYADYLESVGATNEPTWTNLPQEARDHYIRKSLKTFGL